MCEARARKCASLFAQRGAGWICGWKHWAKCPFLQSHKAGSKTLVFAPFLGKQKSDKALGRDMVVLRNPIVHVKLSSTKSKTHKNHRLKIINERSHTHSVGHPLRIGQPLAVGWNCATGVHAQSSQGPIVSIRVCPVRR